jgi:hypothetical protein
MHGRGLAIAVLMGASLLAGCGDKPQILDVNAKGPDAAPWAASASSPFYAADWKGGDKAAWEAQIRTRNQGQNDYAPR